MWYFEQSTGNIFHDDVVVCGGYSGFGPGKNNPAMQDVPDYGPIPVGVYTLGDPEHDPIVGEYAIPLIPDPGNEMFGRSGFFWHGDNKAHVGASSHGCIISLRVYRQEAYASGEKLTVRIGDPQNSLSRLRESAKPVAPNVAEPQAGNKTV